MKFFLFRIDFLGQRKENVPPKDTCEVQKEKKNDIPIRQKRLKTLNKIRKFTFSYSHT